jgi:hypothetical protein
VARLLAVKVDRLALPESSVNYLPDSLRLFLSEVGLCRAKLSFTPHKP